MKKENILMTKDKKKINKIRKETIELIRDITEKYGMIGALPLGSTPKIGEEVSVEEVEQDIPLGIGDIGISVEINDVDIPLDTSVENDPSKMEKHNNDEAEPKKHDNAPLEHVKGEKDNVEEEKGNNDSEKDNVEGEKEKGESEGNDEYGNKEKDKDENRKDEVRKEEEKEEEEKFE